MSPLTPESWAHLSRPRSEVANLRAGLALSITVGIPIILAIVGIVIVLSAPSAATVAVLAVAVALAAIGWFLRRGPWGPWISLAALALIVGMGIASPDTRVDVLVMGTYTVFFLAILQSSRGWGLALIGLGTFVMIVVVSRSDLQVQVGSLAINVGMVAVLQMVVAGGWMWWFWHAALDEASRRDIRAAEQETVIAQATALQERTRAWRAAITRTHETILNDLRYVLRAPDIDRTRLRGQLLTTRDRRAQPPSADTAVPAAPEDLQARLAAEFDGIVEVHDLAGGAEWDEEMEPILIELVRNIARHSDASRIDVTLDAEDDVRRITVDDDGTTPMDDSATPGIGRSVVVGEALHAIGARVDERPHRVTITLPRSARSAPKAGRVLIALLGIVLVGSAVGGSPQFLLLLTGASLTYLPVTLAAVGLTALGVVTVLRNQSIGPGVAGLAAVLAVIVTWGMVTAQPACAAAPLVLTTINLALNAFFAILLWVRNQWLWLIAILPFTGVLALDLMPGVRCPIEGADVLLSSAVIMPVLILLSWMSARSAARWESTDRQRWETEVAETARAEAELDLARALGDSVDRAWGQMWAIADGAELDDDRRRGLRTIEADIRASLQADPRTSGGFVQAARHLVSAASAAGVPVHVRALRGSADARPLPSDFIAKLSDMLTAEPHAGASIHVFCDGYEDYLTITLPAATAARGGFTPADTEDLGCCSIEVSYVGEECATADLTVMISRAALIEESAPVG